MTQKRDPVKRRGEGEIVWKPEGHGSQVVGMHVRLVGPAEPTCTLCWDKECHEWNEGVVPGTGEAVARHLSECQLMDASTHPMGTQIINLESTDE